MLGTPPSWPRQEHTTWISCPASRCPRDRRLQGTPRRTCSGAGGQDRRPRNSRPLPPASPHEQPPGRLTDLARQPSPQPRRPTTAGTVGHALGRCPGEPRGRVYAVSWSRIMRPEEPRSQLLARGPASYRSSRPHGTPRARPARLIFRGPGRESARAVSDISPARPAAAPPFGRSGPRPDRSPAAREEVAHQLFANRLAPHPSDVGWEAQVRGHV